jgi:hypothetical protein
MNLNVNTRLKNKTHSPEEPRQAHKNSATILWGNREKYDPSTQLRAGHSICAKRLKTHFFPEGRFVIFAGSRPGGML